MNHGRLIGWTVGDGSGHAGYNVADYFRDGVYLGPDEHGIEPVLACRFCGDVRPPLDENGHCQVCVTDKARAERTEKQAENAAERARVTAGGADYSNPRYLGKQMRKQKTDTSRLLRKQEAMLRRVKR